MKKNSFSQKILSNNIVLLILSAVISLVIWVYMSTGSSNDTTLTVDQIPIQISLSDESKKLGLNTYFADEQTAYASVTVTGNRKLLGSITKDDFIVTANASSVDMSGTYTLPVSAEKKSSINNFQITNCTPSKISVKFDTEKKQSYNILPKFKYSYNEDYYAYVTYENDTVTVTGPSENVRLINKACAVTDDMGKLEASRDFNAKIVLYDENDKELPQTYLTLSDKEVKGTVKVIPKKTVPVVATYKNKPSKLEITSDMLKIDPAEISIAGTEDKLAKIDSLSLDPIDFMTLRNQKYDFDIAFTVPDDIKLIDNSAQVKVTLDLSSMSGRTLNVENFKVSGLPEGYSYEVNTTSLKVDFIGKKSDLEEISESKITAVIDASDIGENQGSQELPVFFELNGSDRCWASGSYLASVTITKK